jgi:hypothetical protein
MTDGMSGMMGAGGGSKSSSFWYGFFVAQKPAVMNYSG